MFFAQAPWRVAAKSWKMSEYGCGDAFGGTQRYMKTSKQGSGQGGLSLAKFLMKHCEPHKVQYAQDAAAAVKKHPWLGGMENEISTKRKRLGRG